MENELLGKIRSTIKKVTFEECDVVYLMVETRKMLERVKDSRGSYSLVSFYCNWALHVEIKKTSPANDILRKIEGAYKGGNDSFAELDFMNLAYLRKDMKRLMNYLKLPTELFDKEARWQSFKGKFIQILIDCPLRPQKGNIKEITYKKKDLTRAVEPGCTMEVISPSGPGSLIEDSVSWEIEIVTRIQTKRFYGSFSNFTVNEEKDKQ